MYLDVEVQGWKKRISVSSHTFRFAMQSGYLEVDETILPLQNEPEIVTSAGRLPNIDTVKKLLLRRSDNDVFVY